MSKFSFIEKNSYSTMLNCKVGGGTTWERSRFFLKYSKSLGGQNKKTSRKFGNSAYASFIEGFFYLAEGWGVVPNLFFALGVILRSSVYLNFCSTLHNLPWVSFFYYDHWANMFTLFLKKLFALLCASNFVLINFPLEIYNL